MTWVGSLRAKAIPWLLERENPAVRYWTLRDLLDRPTDDLDVREARAAIPDHPPVAKLLAAQKRDGYWIQRDFYLPKHDGTFWTLMVLADLGLSADNHQIEQACEFMFTFQREDGAFCRRRRVPGQGMVLAGHAGPCTHARIVRFLIQFGYGADVRTRAAVGWLLGAQHEDGMWDCNPSRRYGCLRASLDALRVAALDEEAAAHPAMLRGGEAVYGLLMEQGMSKYHVGLPWTALEYPYFGYGLIPTLDALLRLGYSPKQPKIARALNHLLSRQLPGGGWPLDERPYRLPFDVGQPGEPNKWLTLDALRVLKAAAERNGSG
jgi:hypothetical protein